MRLYHFTCDCGIAGIAREGIRIGFITLGASGGKVQALQGWSWLTLDPSWIQPWATRVRLKCDRTEWRCTVVIPYSNHVHRLERYVWARNYIPFNPDFQRDLEYVGGWENWCLMPTPIPLDWIVRIDRRPL